MKIALSFPGCHRRGGVERIVFECARFLSGRAHQVDVLASDWETDASANVSYVKIPSRQKPGFINGVSYYRNCSSRLKDLDYDVLATHGTVCPTGGVHWVQSLHRAWLEQCKQFRKPFGKQWILQKLNPLHAILLDLERRHFAERQYAKIIATTPQVRADLHRFYGVPADDVIIIPNGFSPSEFNPARRLAARDDARSRLGLTVDDVALLFAANELDRKGYATLLKALRILDRKDVKLLVVGRPDKNEVQRRAAQAGVAHNVLACGLSTNIADYHAAADLFVLPTQYEAFCLAILEALGSGLPVVTTRVPGAADAIEPGTNGLTISSPTDGEELADAIKSLLNSDVRARMTAAAAPTVRQYQWPNVLESYEQVLLQHARGSDNLHQSRSQTVGAG